MSSEQVTNPTSMHVDPLNLGILVESNESQLWPTGDTEQVSPTSHPFPSNVYGNSRATDTNNPDKVYSPSKPQLTMSGNPISEARPMHTLLTKGSTWKRKARGLNLTFSNITNTQIAPPALTKAKRPTSVIETRSCTHGPKKSKTKLTPAMSQNQAQVVEAAQ